MITDFGKIVKELREKEDISQESLAKEVGISTTYLRKIEKSQRLPSGEITIKLALAFGEDPEKWLLMVGYEKAQEKDDPNLIKHYEIGLYKLNLSKSEPIRSSKIDHSTDFLKTIIKQKLDNVSNSQLKLLYQSMLSFIEMLLENDSLYEIIDQYEETWNLRDIINETIISDDTTATQEEAAKKFNLFLETLKNLSASLDAESPDTVLITSKLVEIPVFDSGAGEPANISSGGNPFGTVLEYKSFPISDVDQNSFCVIINGDSMETTIFHGDKVLIVPSHPLDHGDICFAAWPDGRRLIKRYRKYGNMVVLDSDNKAHDPIELDPEKDKDIRLYKVTQLVRYF